MANDSTAPIPMLEGILDTEVDPDRRARAYAALTISCLLAPSWTHVVAKKDSKGRTVGHETVVRLAGQLVGDRANLERRLDELLTSLTPAAAP